MTADEATKKLEKCVEFIRKQFPLEGETAFGLVIIVSTDEDPEGNLGFIGSMTIRETGEVIDAYLSGDGDESDEEQPPIVLN